MTRSAAPVKARRRSAAARGTGKALPRCSQDQVEVTPVIRDAIIRAAVEAGEGDMVVYLKKQAETHPNAFLTLLGKVLPTQLAGGKGEPVNLEFSVRFITGDRQ